MSIDLGANDTPIQGRTRSTLIEIKARFVDHPDFSNSTTRLRIWSAFERATGMLRSVVPISAMWIAGSFVTTKRDPADIDVIYIVSASHYADLHDDSARRRVALFSKNGALMARGIPVDCSILVWEPIPEPSPDNPTHVDYLKWRGYWDDFLQRHVEDKTAVPTAVNSVPRRGYLEVIDSGFIAG